MKQIELGYGAMLFACMMLLIMIGCITDGDNVPVPRPTTIEEVKVLRAESEMKADLKNTEQFRSMCAKANWIWLIGLAFGLGAAAYCRSKLALAAGITCAAMVPITFTLSYGVPRYAPAIAVASIVALVVGGFGLAVCLLKGERGSLREVVATFQRTKRGTWNSRAKRVADGVQSAATKAKVKAIKRTLPEEQDDGPDNDDARSARA